MMNNILFLLLGAIAWQTVTLITALAFDNEDILARVATGIPGLILQGGAYVVNSIRLAQVRKRYKYYQLWGKTGLNGKPEWIQNFLMTDETAARFRRVGTLEEPIPYCARLIREGEQINWVPRACSILSLDSLPAGYTKDFIEKFLIKG